jgi:hypothetical protein
MAAPAGTASAVASASSAGSRYLLGHLVDLDPDRPHTLNNTTR